MMRILTFTFVLSMISVFSVGQKNLGVQMIASGTNTSLRGMSMPTDNVIWVSGSNGTVGKSVDSGKSFRWIIVKGFEQKDFRDIEAFDSTTALLMVVDNPAYILKTIDGGKTWKTVFEKNKNGMFLDAMDFKNSKEGICIGDPLVIGSSAKRFFYIIRTNDGGDTWTEVPLTQLPPAAAGEAIFSASGSNISFINHPDFEFVFVTGGTTANISFIGKPGGKSKMVNVPAAQGKESTGIFSLATDKQKRFYCIGGDYKGANNASDNFYFSTDLGEKWGTSTVAPPFGYRSCVVIVSGNTLVSCGTNGVDYTTNPKREWKSITREGFNVCKTAPGSKTVFLAGSNGKIGKLILP